MKIRCTTGLTGELLMFANSVGLIKRDDAPFPGREYSTHYLFDTPRGLEASGGHYDLTLEEAIEDFAERTGMPL